MTDKVPANSVIMVSPPVAMMQFEPAPPIPNLKLVVTGSRDEYAPPDVVEQLIQTWNPATGFAVINGADHFFYGHTDKLSTILLKHT